MASNYNRKSTSSGSRKSTTRGRAAGSAKAPRPSSAASSTRSTGRSSSRAASPGRTPSSSKTPRAGQQNSYRAIPGGRYSSAPTNARSRERLTSVRVGDLPPRDRANRAQSRYRRYLIRLSILAAVVAALVIGAAAAYNSNLFAIESISVTGVEHLTTAEMEAMAQVPSNTTLLRVDAAGIKNRLLQNTWVQDAEVKRIFPNTLELAVVERSIAAVVEVPTADAKSVKKWAIASDHLWLMPIPDQNSEAGKKTSAKIYEDAAKVLSITDVPYSTQAELGMYCADSNVNNALDIVSGMTTELSGRVKQVSAAGPEETKLVLDNGVEIAFGKAERIRDKERVCLQIMEENPGVVYINVRVVEKPTWRAL